jgi:hypothetical protein
MVYSALSLAFGCDVIIEQHGFILLITIELFMHTRTHICLRACNFVT